MPDSTIPEWLAVIILGIIEGVTEFLPISSTGHLLIPQTLHWLPEQGDVFNVVVQSGAVVAVLVVFWERIKLFARTLNQPATRDYLLKLFVAFALTAVGGVVLNKLDIKLPETVGPVAWATLIGGLVIFALEFAQKRRPGLADITWTVAIAVAAAQLLAAVFPGTSRSGASILMAMALGVARPAATEFSFLLGVPTLLAAGAFKIMLSIVSPKPGAEPPDWTMLALGAVVSAVSAFVVVHWLIRFVQSHTFNGFAVYRVVLGAGLLIYAWQAGL